MNRRRLLPNFITGVLLLLFFGIAFCYRVAFVYEQVFTDDQVRFVESDAYYHMRLVDNISHHFPRHITFDPYTYYPHGTRVPWPPLFDWMISGTAWLIGLGSPSELLIAKVGAWLPPILGSLMVVPLYFVGRTLFGHWAGIISAAVGAFLPGEFLTYSVLGFCDHHVAEVVLASLTLLFLMDSLRKSQRRQLAMNSPQWGNLKALAAPLLYSSLSGLFLGLYLLTWVGGLLLLFILFSYFLVQAVISHLRGKPIDYLLPSGVPMVIVGGAFALPFLVRLWTGRWFLLALPVLLLTPIILVTLSKVLLKRGVSRIYYPLAVLGLGTIVLAALWAMSPSLIKSLQYAFSYVLPVRSRLDIWEMQPLLLPFGKFSFSYAWSRFTTAFLFSLVSLGVLSYSALRRDSPEMMLFIVWSLLVLAAVLGQVRFSYYFAVNAALLTGYLSWRTLSFFGFSNARQSKPVAAKLPGKKRHQNTFKRDAPRVPRHYRIALGLLLILLIIFVPNAYQARVSAAGPYFLPDDAWIEALTWLKANTPEPFGNSEFYYEIYESPPRGQAYRYPESAYGIMSWWSYGHWITRIARRIPVCNPFQQGITQAAQFFTAQDEATAKDIAHKLGIKYIIIDDNMAAGFYGKAAWAGLKEEDFYDIYYQRQGNVMVPVLLFYPAYYRSMSSRLYNFDGEKVSPSQCTVISFTEKLRPDGMHYKEITSTTNFSRYEDAEAYLSRQNSKNYRIVSTSPFVSPVPLEALRHFSLVFSSKAGRLWPGTETIPKVKIFEYKD